MKVLLLGDWSGVHRYLKEGLAQIGVQVVMLSDQDQWKIGAADGPMYEGCWKNADHDETRRRIIKRQQEIGALAKQADIVQLMNATVLCYRNCEQLCQDIKSNAKFFCLGSGGDIFLYRAWKAGKYRYSRFDNIKDIQYTHTTYRQQCENKSQDYIIQQTDGIIPLLYQYAESFREQPQLRRVICMPVNTGRVAYQENRVKNKIIFSHGINNEGAKGTNYIREAMRIVQEKYPNDVECRITAPVPLNQYLDNIAEANVIIDQCLTYGYGMNACQSMARGRVVMSGAEPETLRALSLESCPVINILPNVDDIIAKMERIIEERHQIPQWGIDARKHIERYHDYVDIARQFVNCWTQ